MRSQSISVQVLPGRAKPSFYQGFGGVGPAGWHNQTDPRCFVGQMFVLEAWGNEASNTIYFQKKIVFGPCRRRRQGPKTSMFLKMCRFCCLGTLGVHKNTHDHDHDTIGKRSVEQASRSRHRPLVNSKDHSCSPRSPIGAGSLAGGPDHTGAALPHSYPYKQITN